MLSLHSHPVSLFNPHFPRCNFLVWHPFFMLLPQPKNFLITPLCMAPLSCASPTHSQNFLTTALCAALLSCASPTKQPFFLFHSSLCGTTFLCFSCTQPKIFNCCSLCVVLLKSSSVWFFEDFHEPGTGPMVRFSKCLNLGLDHRFRSSSGSNRVERVKFPTQFSAQKFARKRFG